MTCSDSFWLNIIYYFITSCLSIAAFMRDGPASSKPVATSASTSTMPATGAIANVVAAGHGTKPAEVTAASCIDRLELHGQRLSSVLLGLAVSWESVVVVMFWMLLYSSSSVPSDAEGRRTYYFQNCVYHGTVAFHPWVDVIFGSVHLHDRLIIPILIAALGYLLLNLGVTRTIRPV